MLDGLKQYAADNPQISLGDLHARAHEFVGLASEGSPLDWIEKISTETEVLFLQAQVDDITPGEHAEEARRRFRRAPTFELFRTEHSFIENRPAVKQRLSAFFSP